jgi:hypothetical protein
MAVNSAASQLLVSRITEEVKFKWSIGRSTTPTETHRRTGRVVSKVGRNMNLVTRAKRIRVCLMQILCIRSRICCLEVEKNWFTESEGILFDVEAPSDLSQHRCGPQD